MTPESNDPDKPTTTNPIIAIVISVIVAVIMVSATTVSFLRSGAYTTVKQIKIGIESVESINEDELDIKSPINAQDIDRYAESINRRLKILDDLSDFGPESVSDSRLGL